MGLRLGSCNLVNLLMNCWFVMVENVCGEDVEGGNRRE